MSVARPLRGVGPVHVRARRRRRHREGPCWPSRATRGPSRTAYAAPSTASGVEWRAGRVDRGCARSWTQGRARRRRRARPAADRRRPRRRARASPGWRRARRLRRVRPGGPGPRRRVPAELGYRPRLLRAFDLFPMTHHVECVAVLRARRVPSTTRREPPSACAGSLPGETCVRRADGQSRGSVSEHRATCSIQGHRSYPRWDHTASSGAMLDGGHVGAGHGVRRPARRGARRPSLAAHRAGCVCAALTRPAPRRSSRSHSVRPTCSRRCRTSPWQRAFAPTGARRRPSSTVAGRRRRAPAELSQDRRIERGTAAADWPAVRGVAGGRRPVTRRRAAPLAYHELDGLLDSRQGRVIVDVAQLVQRWRSRPRRRRHAPACRALLEPTRCACGDSASARPPSSMPGRSSSAPSGASRTGSCRFSGDRSRHGRWTASRRFCVPVPAWAAIAPSPSSRAADRGRSSTRLRRRLRRPQPRVGAGDDRTRRARRADFTDAAGTGVTAAG